MNRHLYRIIFNLSRNMLMVVPEIAGTGPSNTARRRGRPSAQRLVCRLTTLQLGLLLTFGSVSLTAQVNIVADGQVPGHQQPTIIHSANGTPQVNIQTPGADGVSHNILHCSFSFHFIIYNHRLNVGLLRIWDKAGL
ncbi:ESPR-type extended signal peptide-containing protein [Photorhabdus sp. RM323S]|uniref:ESPR domain-containing protein n=1 Tax=Photorhabdus sp. RM323S TaxID=3342828 RepID=UPI0036DF50D9